MTYRDLIRSHYVRNVVRAALTEGGKEHAVNLIVDKFYVNEIDARQFVETYGDLL